MWLAIVTSLIVACGAREPPAVPKPKRVTICDVIAEPQKFEVKVVRVRARLSSDCHHGSYLHDFECQYRGIGAYSDPAMDPKMSKQLWDSVCPPSPKLDADVIGVFTGVVRKGSELLVPRHEYDFVITNVSGMRVVDSAVR